MTESQPFESEETPSPKANKFGLWIALSGVVGMLGGMGISATLLTAMPGVIAASGLVGNFEMSAKSGDTETSFKFNPNTTSVEDLVRDGLSDKSNADALALAVSGSMKQLPASGNVASLFRRELLTSKTGPFDPRHHWHRDITSTDGILDLVNLKERMSDNTSAAATQKYEDLRSFVLNQVRLGTGIFGSTATAATLSFPDKGSTGEIKGHEAAVCAGSGLEDKPLLISAGITKVTTFIVHQATGKIDQEACKSWKKRPNEKRVWIQLSQGAKQKLFGAHALSVESGWVDIITRKTASRFKAADKRQD